VASPISLDVVLPERGPEDDSTAGGPYMIDDMKFGREVAVPIAIEVVSIKTDEVSWAEEDELLPFSEDVMSVAFPRIGEVRMTGAEDGSRDEALLTAPPAVDMTSTMVEDDRAPGDSVATVLELARRPTEELAAVVVENSNPVERLLENVLEV